MSHMDDLRDKLVELAKDLQVATLERYVNDLIWLKQDNGENFFTESQEQEIWQQFYKLRDHIQGFE